MEEECGGDIVMSTLMESGVSIPGDFSSVSQFTSEALTSICAQLLNLIDPSAAAASEMKPVVVVDSLPERLSCVALRQFLHPSQDDSFRLLTFLLERLSNKKQQGLEASPLPGGDIASMPKVDDTFRDTSDETFDMHLHKVEAVLKDLTMTSEIPQPPNSHAQNASADGSTAAEFFSLRQSSGYEQPSSVDPSESEQPNYETVELQNQHNVLLEELESGSSELSSLDSELELLNLAAGMLLLDEKQPGVMIVCVFFQDDDVRLTLEAKKLCLLDQLHVEEEPEAKDKFHKLKTTELDLQSLSSEIQKREEERCKLQTELERQPKAAPRKSYIHGIKEITKNSPKLDSDIQRISGETRELQLESNSIRERLHRSYAVVDEMVTRELKKDPAMRQVYKLVTSIHGIFEQISEKILMTDRLRREAVDYEKKLGSITSRGMSLEKLQADLDAIRQENQSLEKQLN
ncbi:hypothetical protein HID58_024519 [Brassica napus]|uniref:Coiled-coil domain-containing protein 22 n=1 Tax=Brassica napus TaxID=3708 RepID=A0ABQ7XGH6_BRANA|nr:hypothetical protein HID58_024519 [Brassica napus]